MKNTIHWSIYQITHHQYFLWPSGYHFAARGAKSSNFGTEWYLVCNKSIANGDMGQPRTPCLHCNRLFSPAQFLKIEFKDLMGSMMNLGSLGAHEEDEFNEDDYQ